MTRQDERTILVTGATGAVGNEVVKQLASSSASSGNQVVVRAAVHSQDKSDKFNQYKAVEIVNMDYNKPETVADALNEVDKLFLLTVPALNMPEIHSNLVKEVKKNAGITHIVKLSSMGADTPLGTAVGRLHR